MRAKVETGTSGLICADLTGKIIGTFYEVYNQLGFGFLEIVYHRAMVIALRDKGLHAEVEFPIVVTFREQNVGQFFADIVIEGLVIVELKALRAIEPAHEAQILNYLRASEIEVGLLLNFGPRPQFRRFLFDNPRKICVNQCSSVAAKN
jgi:GxxExxY protein